jgi:hypothetical protein
MPQFLTHESDDSEMVPFHPLARLIPDPPSRKITGDGRTKVVVERAGMLLATWGKVLDAMLTGVLNRSVWGSQYLEATTKEHIVATDPYGALKDMDRVRAFCYLFLNWWVLFLSLSLSRSLPAHTHTPPRQTHTLLHATP